MRTNNLLCRGGTGERPVGTAGGAEVTTFVCGTVVTGSGTVPGTIITTEPSVVSVELGTLIAIAVRRGRAARIVELNVS